MKLLFLPLELINTFWSCVETVTVTSFRPQTDPSTDFSIHPVGLQHSSLEVLPNGDISSLVHAPFTDWTYSLIPSPPLTYLIFI